MQDYKYPSLSVVAILLLISFALLGDSLMEIMSLLCRQILAGLCLLGALGIVGYMWWDMHKAKKKNKMQNKPSTDITGLIYFIERGQASGLRQVMRFPSRATGSSTQLAPLFLRSTVSLASSAGGR